MLAVIPQYAIYLIHRLYNFKKVLSNIKSLSVYLIQETATHNPKVDRLIKMAEITKDAGYTKLTDQEIGDIVKKNEEQNLKLRQFFFAGGQGNVWKN